jgi:hypothetical protein
MKGTKILAILVLALALMVSLPEVSEAVQVGTAFTYQGRLMDGSDAAEGPYDFEFKLFDDPCTGAQQGVTVDINSLDVIDGYFTSVLDFGADVFAGDARWLEISVRPAELEDQNEYTLLSPRQQITPAPYAIDANTLSGHKVSDFASASHHHDSRYVNTDGDRMVAQIDGWWIFEVENTGKGTGIESRAFTDAVCGVASADGGTGVRGKAGGQGGYGVYGYASDPDSYAVYGEAICATNNTNYGGYFTAAGKYGRGVYGEGTGESGRGLLGKATGLYGTGAQGTATGQYGMGVYGFASGSNAYGVAGTSSGTSGRAVYGLHTTGGTAGYFEGQVYVSGKVGIGITNPSPELEIYGDKNDFVGMYISNPNTGSSSSEGIYFKNEDGTVAGIRLHNTDEMAIFDNRPEGHITLHTDGYERVKLDKDGNLGIWTSEPKRRLDINGVMRLEPTYTFPTDPSDGDLCVTGKIGSRHIYCYLNGGWRQLD